jgi:hypothetical protein
MHADADAFYALSTEAASDAILDRATCTRTCFATTQHLLQLLQARGWAIELCAGVDDDGYSANTAAYLFTVSIVLTEAGLAAGPGCGLAPVALLFQYLKLLTDTGVHVAEAGGLVLRDQMFVTWKVEVKGLGCS